MGGQVLSGIWNGKQEDAEALRYYCFQSGRKKDTLIPFTHIHNTTLLPMSKEEQPRVAGGVTSWKAQENTVC